MSVTKMREETTGVVREGGVEGGSLFLFSKTRCLSEPLTLLSEVSAVRFVRV